MSSLNSVEHEIGFRLEGFFFSVFFFKINDLLLKNRYIFVPMDDDRQCFLYFWEIYCSTIFIVVFASVLLLWILSLLPLNSAWGRGLLNNSEDIFYVWFFLWDEKHFLQIFRESWAGGAVGAASQWWSNEWMMVDFKLMMVKCSLMMVKC